jgi:hypothetical protein
VVGAVAVAALVAFAVFGVVRPAKHEDDAVAVAVEAIDGTTPNVGTWGSCDYEPGFSNAILRPRYRCVVRLCRRVRGRVEVTHDLLGGWSYEVTASIPGIAKTGDSDASEATKITELDPAEWMPGGLCGDGG